jgi:PIN domain nuclease of toxin-antitoxin system
MKNYLLDTHAVIWLLTNDDKLNENIREDIEFFQSVYFVSVESLREIVILRSLNKIDIENDLGKIISDLEEKQVWIIPIELKHIKTLEKLPIYQNNGKQHNDPFDRMLIAQAITDNLTVISADAKFPFYRQYGLNLLIN